MLTNPQTEASGMALLNFVFFSLLVLWLWSASWIGAFMTGLLEGCISTLAASFVALCCHEFERCKEKHKRDMKRVSKAEGRQEVSSEDVMDELNSRIRRL
jgi:hypothetical protein